MDSLFTLNFIARLSTYILFVFAETKLIKQ